MSWLGRDNASVVGSTRVQQLDPFAPLFSLMYLLSPYINFVLYLDLYVLGDDSCISKGSFMRTKHL